MARSAERVEFGDWQTPDALASAVLGLLVGRFQPRSILEPTCGQGAFLTAAASAFPFARLVGFDISEHHVAAARARLPASQASVEVGDFFAIPWERVLDALPDPLLIVGNPPWVTNSTLGTLEADNLPAKANLKRRAGMEAMTGKSNFDISEWMLTRLLEVVHARRFCMAMLCKASVARRILEHASASGWRLSGELRAIDARAHFAANAPAVLLRVWSSESNVAWPTLRWAVYPELKAVAPSSFMGVVGGVACSNVVAHARTRDLEGSSEVEWRSGLKHDCSRVMELAVRGSELVNGFGEVVALEAEHVYALLKGSDIANGRLEPRRAVIVTQRQLSDDTRPLQLCAPRLWAYLGRYRERLEARRSRIYHGRPPFAIFGIGDYSFAPHKVAICGLYKKLKFAALGPVEGRPVMVDDTAYFLPCGSADEAEALARALNGHHARAYFEARLFWDAKRPIGKALLQSLSLERLLRAEGLPSLPLSRWRP